MCARLLLLLGFAAVTVKSCRGQHQSSSHLGIFCPIGWQPWPTAIVFRDLMPPGPLQSCCGQGCALRRQAWAGSSLHEFRQMHTVTAAGQCNTSIICLQRLLISIMLAGSPVQ